MAVGNLTALVKYAQDVFELEPDTVMFMLPVSAMLLGCAVLLVAWRMMRVLQKPPPSDP